MHWLLTKARAPYLVVLGLITIALAVQIPKLKVELGNRSMNARTPEQEAAYGRFREEFGNDALMVLSITRSQLLSNAGLMLVAEITEAAAAIPGVKHAYSLTNAEELVNSRDGAVRQQIIPSPYARDDLPQLATAALDRNAALMNLFFSEDRETAGVYVEVQPGLTEEQEQETLSELRHLMNSRHGSAEFHLAGILVQKYDIASLIRRDQRLVILLSGSVLLLVLALTMRCPLGVAMPLLVTTISLTWTLGLYAALGFRVNAVTSLLPPTVMVLSIAFSIHLYCGWREACTEADCQIERVTDTLKHLFMPCFFTSLTSAIGLLSLTLSGTPAVQLFGAFGALGIGIAFIVGITLVPVLFSYMPPSPNECRKVRFPVLDELLHHVMHITLNYPIQIIVASMLLGGVSLFGVFRLKNNTDLLETVSHKTALYRDTKFIDTTLGGTTSLEFVVTRNDGKPLEDAEDLIGIDRFAAAVRNLEGVGFVFSIADIIKHLHRAEEEISDLAIPNDADVLALCIDLIKETHDDPWAGHFIRPDFRKARVSVRIHAMGTADAEPLIRRIEDLAAIHLAKEHKLDATGDFYYVTTESNQLVRNQIKSFLIALVLTMLCIGLVFRSLRCMVLSLAANIAPIVIICGIMGFLGIDFSIGTAMIPTVVIGLAVDDTIHYLTEYRRSLSNGVTWAIARTTTRTGRALVIATLVLTLGFWTGALGSFKETVYFSLFTGAALVLALIFDMLVLPAFLIVANRIKTDRK